MQLLHWLISGSREAGDEASMAAARQVLDENMPYFGYGYIKDPASLVPHVGLMFWSFRVMVGLGVYFIAFLPWSYSWAGKKQLERF